MSRDGTHGANLNLDQALREKYRVNLKMLLRQFSITTVYVTHDHNEALILGDRLAIMNRGRRAAAEGAPVVGDVVWLAFRRYHLFDKATGMRVRRTWQW